MFGLTKQVFHSGDIIYGCISFRHSSMVSPFCASFVNCVTSLKPMMVFLDDNLFATRTYRTLASVAEPAQVLLKLAVRGRPFFPAPGAYTGGFSVVLAVGFRALSEVVFVSVFMSILQPQKNGKCIWSLTPDAQLSLAQLLGNLLAGDARSLAVGIFRGHEVHGHPAAMTVERRDYKIAAVVADDLRIPEDEALLLVEVEDFAVRARGGAEGIEVVEDAGLGVLRDVVDLLVRPVGHLEGLERIRQFGCFGDHHAEYLLLPDGHDFGPGSGRFVLLRRGGGRFDDGGLDLDGYGFLLGGGGHGFNPPGWRGWGYRRN